MQLGEGLGVGRQARVATALLAGMIAAGATLCACPTAVAGSSLRVSDKAHLHLVSGGGNNALNETGKATGTLPGTVHVQLSIHTYTASSRFTIETKDGSISGTGTGKLKTGKGGYASFGGAVAVTGGTGRYSHVHGKGGLYGTINRRDDAMTVKVSGTLRL